jgi:hypothetical protein
MHRPLAESLRSRGASALHSPVFWGVTLVVVAALVSTSVFLATRAGPPAPSTSTRVVALGDSVPYGHGLANPYLTPQIGLPPRAVSQGPSTLAYPSLVTRDLRLTMSVRPANCHLSGDQLAISGAVADPVDNTKPDGQCPIPPQQARSLDNQLAAADLAHHPARLVLLQDGADDIDFAGCLEYELARVAGANIGLGTVCVQNGAVTPQLAKNLEHVRASLAAAIEEVAPYSRRVAVADYYQPIPMPSQIADDAGASGLGTNLVCAGLKANAAATYAAAQVVLAALNEAIAGAVGDARGHGVRNVNLIELAHATDGHAMCTIDPWVYSGERVSDATLAADAERILAAKTCSGTALLHGSGACASFDAAAARAERNLQGYVWRAAHPTAAGQRAIAGALTAALGASP